MKKLSVLFLLLTISPSAFADKWEKVSCRYSRDSIPDDDSGTWCRHFYLCRDQGKWAFIQYTPGSMTRFCCDARDRSCSLAYDSRD